MQKAYFEAKSRVELSSTTLDSDLVYAIHFCPKGHDDQSLKIPESFADENEMIFQELELGRLEMLTGLRNFLLEPTAEIQACWELPLPCC